MSEHGYDELAEQEIPVIDIVSGCAEALELEEYPKGPCVLILQKDRHGGPIHVVWGIPRDASTPAVLVAAYRPDPDRWTADFTRRKK